MMYWTTALVTPSGTVTTMSGGRLSTGFSLSRTVTVNRPAALLPEESVAVQSTGVAPSGKTEPLAGEQTTVTSEQLSVAATVNCTRAVLWPGSFGTLRLGERLSVGI